LVVSRRAWACFFGVAVLWGIPYFFIKVAVGEVAPPVVTFTRLALGALILVPIAWRRHALGPTLRRWPWVVALGAGYFALPLTLIPFAELNVPSALTAIMIAGVPLMVALLYLRWERPTPLELAGLGVGYAGVAALVGFDLSGRPGELLGAGLLVVVTVCYAAGPILLVRKLSGLDPLGSTSLGMVVGALILAGPAIVASPHRVPSLPVLLSLLGLGLLSTALAYVLYFTLNLDAGPQRASLVTYLNPMVALGLGVLVLGERVGPTAILGGALILAGSWLATRGRRPAVAAPARAA
jgi:drug/metabolite transporter (DMT)-like permease